MRLEHVPSKKINTLRRVILQSRLIRSKAPTLLRDLMRGFAPEINLDLLQTNSLQLVLFLFFRNKTAETASSKTPLQG